MVRVNLGQLDVDNYYIDEAGQLAARPVEDLEQEREVLAQIQEERPSGLRRGLGRLAERVGGWFDRGGVQVAERVAQPVDELRDIQPVREPRLYDVSPTDPLLR